MMGRSSSSFIEDSHGAHRMGIKKTKFTSKSRDPGYLEVFGEQSCMASGRVPRLRIGGYLSV